MDYSSKPAKQKTEGAILKQERSQYIQMLLSAQVGREMTEKAFGNESNQYPPSLTRNGEMYFGTKADLLVPLEKDLPQTTTFPNVYGEIIDGCVLLRLIPPIKDSTFSQYMVNLTGE